MRTFIHKKFYFFLIFFVILLIVWKRAEIVEAILLWKDLKWYYILLAIALQFVNYGSVSMVYRSLIKTQGKIFSVNHLFRAVTVLLFFNRAMPSLGIAGGTFMIERLHQDGISRGRALIITILYYVNYYLAFFILLLAGFIYLFFKHDLGRAHIAATVIAISIIVFIFVAIIIIVNKRSRLAYWANLVKNVLGKFSFRLRDLFRRKNDKIVKELDEIFYSWKHYWKDFSHMITPLIYGLLQHFSEVLTLYIIFLALGHPVPIWILAVGYVTSGILAFLTFVPNGIGVYEAAMVLILNGLEIPLPVALSGVLAFRAIFYWLPIPVGFYFYRRFNNGYCEYKNGK